MKRCELIARRDFLGRAVGSAGLLALAGCLPPNRPSPQATVPAAAALKIAASVTPDFVQVPLIVASAIGAFEKYGLSETAAPMAAPVMSSALVSKSLNYVYVAVAGPMLSLVNKGKDVVAFGQLTQQNSNLVAVSADFVRSARVDPGASTLDKLKALKGARWAAIAPNSAIQVVIDYLMSQAGYQVNRDYSVVYIDSIDGMVSALEQKQIDAFLANAPGPETIANKGSGVVYLDLASTDLPAFKDMTWGVLWALREDLTANPDLAKSTLRALWSALKLIHDDPNRARDLVQPTFSKLPAAVFEQSWKDSLALYPATPRISTDGFDKGLKLFNQQGAAADHVSHSAEELFTNQYVDAVASEFS